MEYSKKASNCKLLLLDGYYTRNFAPYIGFTEAEVKTLTEKYNQDYEKKITGGTHHGTFLFYPTRTDRVEC